MVDRDNFDQVLARHKPELHMSGVGAEARELVIRFDSLDDFHPDAIFERVDFFQSLKRTRTRLQNSSTYADAAAEVRSWANMGSTASRSEPESAARVPEPEPAPEAAQDLFDQILDSSQVSAAPRTAPTGSMDWNAYIRSVVEPYTMPGVDPQQPQLVACVDSVATGIMRAILHHRDFQAIEAAWRAVHFLIRRLETGASLSLNLVDISKQELLSNTQSDNLQSTGLYKLLVDQTVGTPGGGRWSVIVGNYTFDHTREDAELLSHLGGIAERAGAAFLGAAHSHLVGCESLAATPDPDDWALPFDSQVAGTWSGLRHLPQASYVGLALPRFLLRLPYGNETDPIEQFDFDELGEGSNHDDYLWGNPAFACACLLAQSFTEQGWNMRPGTVLELDGLPLHVRACKEESEVKPCAEAILTDRAADRIAAIGLMPLLSHRSRDAVRLGGFRSLTGGQLAGPWGNRP
jgi:type VI secretion system protein ImpC